MSPLPSSAATARTAAPRTAAEGSARPVISSGDGDHRRDAHRLEPRDPVLDGNRFDEFGEHRVRSILLARVHERDCHLAPDDRVRVGREAIELRRTRRVECRASGSRPARVGLGSPDAEQPPPLARRWRRPVAAGKSLQRRDVDGGSGRGPASRERPPPGHRSARASPPPWRNPAGVVILRVRSSSTMRGSRASAAEAGAALQHPARRGRHGASRRGSARTGGGSAARPRCRQLLPRRPAQNTWAGARRLPPSRRIQESAIPTCPGTPSLNASTCARALGAPRRRRRSTRRSTGRAGRPAGRSDRHRGCHREPDEPEAQSRRDRPMAGRDHLSHTEPANRLASARETTNDTAVTAADRRPSAVARSASAG